MPHDETPSYAERVRAMMLARGNSKVFLDKLDADLRRKIASKLAAEVGCVGCPDLVEREFNRVMRQVFEDMAH